ncbi:HEAT repeat domain-containing protein [Schlesneria paludicola]|uniref:HEAT repeat domain-containing protein n=1 Tax=Schlesneria paludicola TaxID=360056 RepID=UPI000299D970|nr:HEAT repeat domain-containing protein [Schlesneria paludicola]
MNKWYHPFGLLLLAAMLGDLSGCAQTRDWLAKTSSKKRTEEEIAAAEKKLNEKTPRKKSSVEVADSKPSKSKDSASKDSKESAVAKDSKSKDKDKDIKTASATKSKSKAIDAEHEKFTAAETAKKKKPATETRVESGSNEKDEIALAGSTKPAKPAKPKASASTADDDLYSFVDKMEKPTATKPVKKVAKPEVDEEVDAVAETKPSSRKNVVQVKKEVAKIEENDDIADWLDTETQPESKSVKSAIVSEPTEDESPLSESDKPVARKEKPRKAEAAHSWDDDLAEAKATNTRTEDESSLFEEKPVSEKKLAVTRVSEKKSGAHHESQQGLTATCPQADGELRDVLGGMDLADSESLKQGLHRIGQLGGDGRAAEPLLRQMLKHEDAFVRVHAALAMARLNLTTGESAAVVTASLKSRDASLRSFSVAVLDEMGPQANEVLGSLAASMNDRDGQIRLRAAEVLIRHDDWSLQALQCLLSCLSERDENVRWLATYSFAELAPQSPEAVQALMKATGDPVSKVRVGAVYALGEIGPYAKRSGAELHRLMDSTKDEELKSAIAYSLQQIEK